MADGDRGPRLLEPVTLGSRVVPCPGVRYSEVAGIPVLWEPVGRVLHELTPAGAALWAALDGRSVGEVVVAAVGPADPARGALERDTVDVVRRLRALGLAEDRGDAAAPPADAAAGVLFVSVTLAGRVVRDGAGAVVVVGGDPGGCSAVELDVAHRRLVAVAPPGGRPVAAAVDLVGLGVLDDDPVLADGAAPGAVGPVEALAAVMAATPVDPDPPAGLLDAMAALVEAVPVEVRAAASV
jgi:hypothetical protein